MKNFKPPWQQQGNMPILLTIAHDWPVQETWEKLIEINIFKFSLLLSEAIKKKVKAQPYIIRNCMPYDLNCRFKKRFKHSKNFSYMSYHESIRQKAKAICQEFNYCLLLDLHGFRPRDNSNANFTQSYDIIFGTNHRQTMNGSNLDKFLAGWLQQSGYCTYLPSTDCQIGELFTATHRTAHIHVNLNKKLIGLQMEINIALRHAATLQTKGLKLADCLAQGLITGLKRG